MVSCQMKRENKKIHVFPKKKRRMDENFRIMPENKMDNVATLLNALLISKKKFDRFILLFQHKNLI